MCVCVCSSSGSGRPSLTRRMTSPEIKLQGVHPPSPYHAPPQPRPHMKRASEEAHQPSPRHRPRKSEGNSYRERSEVRKPGGRGVPIIDRSAAYFQNGSLQRPQKMGVPKHVSDVSHSQGIHHVRTVSGGSDDWDITPTHSQLSQSSYGIGGGDGNVPNSLSNQWYVTSSSNDEYPHSMLRETSSAHSSQSDSTYFSSVSEPTYNRAR